MSDPIKITISGVDKVDPERPELRVGDRIEWHNNTRQPYRIDFRNPSPFAGGAKCYKVAKGETVASDPIEGGRGKFEYHATPDDGTSATTSAERGPGSRDGIFEPVIIVRKPEY